MELPPHDLTGNSVLEQSEINSRIYKVKRFEYNYLRRPGAEDNALSTVVSDFVGGNNYPA